MKKSNKGFSLVELIIVIAIMAILAAAIAPALIRYIDKSRKADDLQLAGNIASAASAALANEDAYAEINFDTSNTDVEIAKAGTATAKSIGSFVNGSATKNGSELVKEINSTMGTSNKIKYTKGDLNSVQIMATSEGKIKVSFNGQEVNPEVSTNSSWK
ncbi:MAG: prepilin-type N-terminal cleavage/methylation domain-containing protein [Lachnospiraceae bacterium]|nr:prepilin-type N-terminal cleavage/methylation domain-containing protein [Lachnospiraceae bacterium]